MHEYNIEIRKHDPLGYGTLSRALMFAAAGTVALVALLTLW